MTTGSPLLLACLLAALAGCAHVVQTPASFTLGPAAEGTQAQQLAQQLDIDFDTGYRRTIRAGSQWLQVGSIPQGAVYKPFQDVFTLEGAHMHEAYLVVQKDRLVGFYLPAERAFSPLRQQLSIAFH